MGSGNTTLADNWTCGVRHHDEGGGVSGFVNSSQVTIISPPVMDSSRISAGTNRTNETIQGFCNATDADVGNVTYYYKWYNDQHE